MKFKFYENIANLYAKIKATDIDLYYKVMVVGKNLLAQTPLALDTPLLIDTNQGTPISSVDGEVDILADGTMRLNDIGTYYLAAKLQVDKGTPSGRTNFVLYLTAQIGAGSEDVIDGPIYLRFNNNKLSQESDFTRIFDIENEDTKLRMYFYNDSSDSGENDGSLLPFTPTAGTGPNGTDLSTSPSSTMIIKKFSYRG